MARPQAHSKSGVYRVRVAVPKDLRLLIGKAELIRTLGTKNADQARLDHAAVVAEFRAVIEAARAELGGKARRVPPREVAALAGEAYRQAVAEAEAKPGRVADREAELDGILDQLVGDHGEGLEDAREFVPGVGDLADARAFLRARGIAADADSVERTAVALWSARQYAAHVALRRAAGDWSPDPDAARFPTCVATPPVVAQPQAAPKTVLGLSLDDLLAAFAREADQRAKTHDKRKAALRSFRRVIDHDDAARVSKADVRAWKERLLSEGRALKTVADAVAMLRPVWRWGAANGLLADGPNPFSGMAPKTPKRPVATRLPYDDAEATRILTAARRERGFLRWLPWLLAFTGCRIEEACGAVREDVREVHGVWCLDVNAERPGRALKTSQSQRLIPLHPALIAEGFVRYATKLPNGSPLFPDLATGFYGGRGETATKRHGRWVRSLGITDRRKAPAHSWRHRMKDSLRFLRVPSEAADAILGHDHATNAGAGYGAGWRGRPDELIRELARVPSPVDPLPPPKTPPETCP